MSNDLLSTQLSQRIEREVRQLIGDQHMQIIALRCLLEQIQQQPQPQEQPKPPPQPIPPQPEQPPEKPKPQAANGHYKERIAR